MYSQRNDNNFVHGGNILFRWRMRGSIASILILLLSLFMHTGISVYAAEQTINNTILDLEEGKLWSEDKGSRGANNAKASISVQRLRINYDDHTIDWQITYNVNRESWGSFNLGVILPETDLSKTQIVRLWEDREDWNSIVNAERDFFANGGNHRWGYRVGTDKFNSEYWDRVQKQLQGTQSGSDMNTWRDTNRLSAFLISGENAYSKQIYWRITTYHDENTVLDNVPMVATMSTWINAYQRTSAIGPFGIAAWHELKVPKRVYVDDIDHLTENDKKRILATIKEDTDKWLNTLDNKEKGQREENEAKQEIVDNNMYVKTFSDGSKLRLSLKSFVRQRELHVLKQDNVVNWRDSVDIALGVNDPNFPNRLVAIPADGNFPDGLYWDQSAATEDVPNGKILGVPKVDWSKVSGAQGKKQVTFQFNIALRKEDGSINHRSETYKPITITVRQDQGAVPVGVANFPQTPYRIFALLSVAAISLTVWRRYVQEREERI